MAITDHITDHEYVNMCLWFTNSEKWDENNPFFIVTSFIWRHISKFFKSSLYFERKSPIVPSEPFDTLELDDFADFADDFTAIFVALAIFLTSSNFCWFSINWACCCKIELTFKWFLNLNEATSMLVTNVDDSWCWWQVWNIDDRRQINRKSKQYYDFVAKYSHQHHHSVTKTTLSPTK